MMNRYPNPDIEMLQFPELSKDCDIFHFVTTRHGGVSKGNYATFNLGEYAGDDPENVRTNRQILSDAIGIDPERLLVPHQIHGTTIRIIEDSFFRLPVQAQKQYIDGTDALVTTLQDFQIVQAVCGDSHTAALSQEGYVFVCGYGEQDGYTWVVRIGGHGSSTGVVAMVAPTSHFSGQDLSKFDGSVCEFAAYVDLFTG